MTSWLDDADVFKATLSVIHDGAAILIDALKTAMSEGTMAPAA